ncbi:MAG: TfoX/Sxy family protein [Pseudomonadota bacterium]|jgi:hypothetical protein
MSYDEALAQRLRDAIGDAGRVTEKRMMGGLCLLMNGHMVCGIDRDKGGNDRLMFRVGKHNEARALTRPGASIVDMGGRRIGGFIFVAADACRGRALAAWVRMAREYVGGLPPKPTVRSAAKPAPREPKAPARGRR